MNNLKKIRLLAEKTQAETAKELDVTQHTYSNYELGKTQPDMDTLVKLADFFKTTIDNLLGHEVPYLFDKSTLTQWQRVILELLPQMDDRLCEKTEAYICGHLDGKSERLATIQKFEN